MSAPRPARWQRRGLSGTPPALEGRVTKLQRCVGTKKPRRGTATRAVPTTSKAVERDEARTVQSHTYAPRTAGGNILICRGECARSWSMCVRCARWNLSALLGVYLCRRALWRVCGRGCSRRALPVERPGRAGIRRRDHGRPGDCRGADAARRRDSSLNGPRGVLPPPDRSAC
jgi:hypothetical protein